MKKMKIFIGADHRGFRIKSKVIRWLKELGYEVVDLGAYRSDTPSDYPKITWRVAREVARAKNARGILVCMTGIGPTITANKLRGVYAALCYNRKTAELSRSHNNANVLVLGARFVDNKGLKGIIMTWLKTEFEGGRHLRRVRQIQRIEKATGL